MCVVQFLERVLVLVRTCNSWRLVTARVAVAAVRRGRCRSRTPTPREAVLDEVDGGGL